MSYDMSEIYRLLANMIRIGRVIELDEANARVKLAVAGLTTDWLPWGADRAGKTRKWSPPQIGEQIMIFSPYGDSAQGVAGMSIYQDDSPAPAASKDKETIVFEDGTTFEYDSASNTYTQTIAGTGNWVFNLKTGIINTETAEINATTSVTLDTPDTICTGNLTVAKSFQMGSEGGTAKMVGNVEIEGGSLTHNGKNIGSTHQHGGVQTGGGNTQAPI